MENVSYYQSVGRMLDRRWKNTTIIQKLIQLQSKRKFTIPREDCFYIERFLMGLEAMPDKSACAQLMKEANDQEWPFFASRSKAQMFFRDCMKKREFKRFRSTINLDSGVKGFVNRFIGLFKPDELEQGLETLKIFDPVTHRWSEARFQQYLDVLDALHLSETKKSPSHRQKPVVEYVRLIMEGYMDCDGQLRSRRKIPWKWLMLNDQLSNSQLNSAKKIIEVFLGKPVNQVISITDAWVIEKLGQCLLKTREAVGLSFICSLVQMDKNS